MLVEVVDGALLGSVVVASVGVGSSVGPTVVMLLVVLGPKRYEMYTYGAVHFAEVCYIRTPRCCTVGLLITCCQCKGAGWNSGRRATGWW